MSALFVWHSIDASIGPWIHLSVSTYPLSTTERYYLLSLDPCSIRFNKQHRQIHQSIESTEVVEYCCAVLSGDVRFLG